MSVLSYQHGKRPQDLWYPVFRYHRLKNIYRIDRKERTSVLVVFKAELAATRRTIYNLMIAGFSLAWLRIQPFSSCLAYSSTIQIQLLSVCQSSVQFCAFSPAASTIHLFRRRDIVEQSIGRLKRYWAPL
jgi:hypothetical protein